MALERLKKRDEAELDFMALGALVIRLDPGVTPFEYANSYDLHVSGGEFNVAANLSRAFGQRTGIATAMVDYPLGLRIEAEVRRMGVRPFYKRFAHDGVRGPNMAHVYSDRGQGLRAPQVFYNRSNEAAALLDEGSFDYDELFASGPRSRGRSSPSTSTTATSSGSQSLRRERTPRRRGSASSPPSSSTSMCWSAMRRTCRWAWGSRARIYTRRASSTHQRSGR